MSAARGAGSGSASFPRSSRLLKTDDYSSVFAFRQVRRGAFLVLHVGPKKQDVARLGLVVGKRLARRAVDRNLIKRLAREVFRKKRHTLQSRAYILRLAVKTQELDRQKLCQEMERLLSIYRKEVP